MCHVCQPLHYARTMRVCVCVRFRMVGFSPHQSQNVHNNWLAVAEICPDSFLQSSLEMLPLPVQFAPNCSHCVFGCVVALDRYRRLVAFSPASGVSAAQHNATAEPTPQNFELGHQQRFCEAGALLTTLSLN